METVSECELKCLELRLLELEKIVTMLTTPDPNNVYLPTKTINLNYYVFGKNYNIYYTGETITQPDEENGIYNPSVAIDDEMTNSFKSNSNRYTIPADFNRYGVYEVYEGSELLTRFVIITKSDGVFYYDIEGKRVGEEITEDITELSYNYISADLKEKVAWVIVPKTVTEFISVIDGVFQGFPNLIACYFEKHDNRDISGDFQYMFSGDSNLVAVNYNDLISSIKNTEEELYMVGMFQYCSGLTNVSFNEGVFSGLEVGTLYVSGMFYECDGITSVSFNEGAFGGLTVTDTLYIDYMFYYCDRITSVSFNKGAFSGLVIEGGTLNMNNMFDCCPAIEKIELNDVFSITDKLLIDLFNGTTTKIDTITIKEKDIEKAKLSGSSGSNHNYNLFNFISENTTITLYATDAVVKMLLNLNPEGSTREISLTCADSNIEFNENDNTTLHTFTLEYTGSVWDITDRK